MPDVSGNNIESFEVFLDLKITDMAENPITDICVPLIIGIFGFALPMLIGIVQHIDKKYRSTRLIQLFVAEKWLRVFACSLIASLVALFAYLFILCPDALTIFMLLSCMLLVYSVCRVFYLVYIYQVPASLQQRLLKSPGMTAEKRQVWLEVFYALLERDNHEEIQKGFDALVKWSKDTLKENTPQTYPQELYEAFITIHEKLCGRPRRVIPIPGGTCLLRIFFDNTKDGNGNSRLLSPETLRTFWICLHQQLDYNRDEWFMDYWRHAHQYYDERFACGTLCDGGKTKEAQEIEKAQKEFEEFHLALGGLLLYKQKYNLLQQVTNYSSSVPARYPLVPEISGELIASFIDLFSNAPEGHIKYALKYPFLNRNSGMADDNAFINSWIQRYLVFLFYRHFTHQYHNPNVDANAGHFRVPVEDEAWKSIWRNVSPVLRERMNAAELQAVSAQILRLSDEAMAKIKEDFQSELDSIDEEVGKSA